MKIRTQFIITMLLFGIILVITAASTIITSRLAEKNSEQERIASSIAQGASELSYLSNDYLIYRENQQLKRWQLRFGLLSSQVASLNVDKPEQEVLVRNIKANEQRLKQVFESVASAVRGASPSRSTALDLAFLQVSWSRMAVQSQGLVSDASRLSQLLHQQMDQITERRTVLMYVMVGLFGAFLLASYMLTYDRILKSIAGLQAGAAVIGSGNLDFKIEEKKNDEIGDLSHAFNRMTSSLKEVTASKEDLEREIGERKKAEGELRRQREWLRVTLSSIGDAVIATDTKGQVTFLNPVAVTLTGWQSEETLGQPIQSVFRIINEKTHQPAEDLVARVLSEKRVVALANDTALVAKDGREVPIEDSAAPILDAAGNVIGAVLVFHDVSARRRAQAALHEAHERAVWLARFPEQNPNPVIRASADGTVLYCNPVTLKLRGWKCEVGEVLQNEFMPLVGRAMTEGNEVQEDVQLDGRTYIVWVSPFPGEGYANIYGRDITERKQAEQALRQSEQRLSRAQEIAHLGSWELDLVSNRLTWSDEVYRIFGLQPQEFGATYEAFLEAVHPDDRAAVDAAYSGSLREGRDTYETEHRVVRKSTGEIRFVHERCQHIRDASGRIIRSIGMVHDITERKRMEEELRQSEEKSRLLIKYAPSMFYEIDFHRPGFKSVNDAMCDFLGYTREELLAMNPFDLLDDEGKALFRERIRQRFTGEEISDSVEYKSKTKDGREVHGVLNISFTYKDGKPEGAVVVAHDITERKRAEEALRQRTLELQHLTETLDQQVRERTEELEVANEELTNQVDECLRIETDLRKSQTSLRQLSIELLNVQEKERKAVAGEIHDSIGSSLAAIKFKVEAALTEVADKSSETASALKSLGPVIQTAIDEARRIQMNLRPSMLDDLGLLATVKWLCRQFESTYSGIHIRQNIKIEEHEVPDSLRTVMFRVVQEGLNNVAKHSKAKLVILVVQKAGRVIRLFIKDYGEGFDLSRAQFQNDTAHGFGLRSMRERTELSGGTFEIESTQGKGTTVRASWPI